MKRLKSAGLGSKPKQVETCETSSVVFFRAATGAVEHTKAENV